MGFVKFILLILVLILCVSGVILIVLDVMIYFGFNEFIVIVIC